MTTATEHRPATHATEGARTLPDTEGLNQANAARAYAGAGLAVFPCVPAGKRPLTANGFKDATTDLAQIEAWWQRTPDANIGLVTGHHFDVLDVDVHPAGTGYPALKALHEAGLTRGWIRTVRTPNGGLHLYFPADPAQPQASWSRSNAHIDFRGVGGYIIAPPSQAVTRDGSVRKYSIIGTGNQPGHLPASIIRELLTPPRPAATQRTGTRMPGWRQETLAGWVAGLPEGNRNGGLFWAACRLVELGLTEPQARDLLDGPARSTGLDAREITSTIGSAYRTTHPLDPPSEPAPARAAGVSR